MPPLGSNCSQTSLFPERVWLIGTTNEDANFGNGSINDFSLNDPVLVNQWRSVVDDDDSSRYAVSFGVNKYDPE